MKQEDIAFEDALSDDWRRDLDVAEVSIGNRPMRYLAIVVAVLVLAVAARIVFLGLQTAHIMPPAPNGMSRRKMKRRRRAASSMTARAMCLRTTKRHFRALLDVQDVFGERGPGIQHACRRSRMFWHSSRSDVWSLVTAAEKNDFASPVVLADTIESKSAGESAGAESCRRHAQERFRADLSERPRFFVGRGIYRPRYGGRPCEGPGLEKSGCHRENRDSRLSTTSFCAARRASP